MEANCLDLVAQVLRLVQRPFRASVVPVVAETDVRFGVELFFELLRHRTGEPDLDAVGEDITSALRRWFVDHNLVKLADRYEPFCKLVLKLVDPTKYAILTQKEQSTNPQDRPGASYVLKANGLNLISNSDLQVFAQATWDTLPMAALAGKAHFLEHLARTYVFRNVDDHKARLLDDVEKAEVVQSFCVFLISLVLRFKLEIRSALLVARFTPYLESILARCTALGIHAQFVDLDAEPRSSAEYRLCDPLTPLKDTAPSQDALKTSLLPEMNRVTIVEAQPGAGKTFLLRFLAYDQANKLLCRTAPVGRLPVFVELKLLHHHSQTIESFVRRDLNLSKRGDEDALWNSLLLLVDGINEVADKPQRTYKTEIVNLLERFSGLRAVVTTRPNSYRGEFPGSVVVLRPLSDTQLNDFYHKALRADETATRWLSVVRYSPFLSSWARVPLHAAWLADILKRGDLLTLLSHCHAVRSCIRDILRREKSQSSAVVKVTQDRAKEWLLAHLAYDLITTGEAVFSEARAQSVLREAKTRLEATSIDVPTFLVEVIDNNLLERVDGSTLKFAHEEYQAYFAACELELQEGQKQGLGVATALVHFCEPHWHESILLFATYADGTTALIHGGADKNPLLAWSLLREAGVHDPELCDRVSEAAYCAATLDALDPEKTNQASAAMPILAAMGKTEYLKRAIIRQRHVLEPEYSWKLTEQERNKAHEKIQQALNPLLRGLVAVFRIGAVEERLHGSGPSCDACRGAIEALKEIGSGYSLTYVLACSMAKTFQPGLLVPGALVEGLIDVGVDTIIEEQIDLHVEVAARWLARACEANFAKAWPAYGRLVRRSPEYYEGEDDCVLNRSAALQWLRQSHASGDAIGSVELGLFLIDNPDMAYCANEGQDLLTSLADGGAKDAQFELGDRTLRGEGLPKDEAKGFGILLDLAEKGFKRAVDSVNVFVMVELIGEIGLPAWLTSLLDNRPESEMTRFIRRLPLLSAAKSTPPPPANDDHSPGADSAQLP